MRNVFISYVRENQDLISQLVKDLRRNSVHCWIDREKLAPGERWKDAIRYAISHGTLFLACFSEESIAKSRSYMNEELTLAIDELRLRPSSKSWFIPILLDKSAVPDRSIGGGETLRDIQWVDLSVGPNTPPWAEGIRRIVKLLDQFDHTKLNEENLQIAEKIRIAIQSKAENDLLGVVRSSAHETIDAALEAFTDDNDLHTYGYLMRPICKVYGNQFTQDQVVRLVTRDGKGNSRTGFHGLCALYDHHFNHMKSLELLPYFKDNFQISYFIKLRERYPSGDLLKIVMNAEQSQLEIDGTYVDSDYFYDKFMNRGESAFLDAVFALENKTANKDEG